MAQEGYEPLLKKSRWCVLKRKENLTAHQQVRLRDLLRYNLQTVRAYLLKEDFQQFWAYNSPLGRLVPGFLVSTNDAVSHRADEEDRSNVARAPRAADQLFQGQEAVFQWCHRGAE
jgi:hypothetical protein